jgi:hypothetical protein
MTSPTTGELGKTVKLAVGPRFPMVTVEGALKACAPNVSVTRSLTGYVPGVA